MVDKTNQINKSKEKTEFHFRGTEMTRLETFLDAAFAFATTMLVISVGNIPKTYPELIYALKAVPSFLASFAAIMIFWTGHRKWSRRFGLEDMPTILISLCLIFVLLVYVYPLRLLFSAMFAWMSAGWLPSQFTINSAKELVNLFIIYGIGLTAMAAFMALLYNRARLAKDVLKLNHFETITTHSEIISWMVLSSTGFISALFAFLMPANVGVFAGFIYMTLPITMPLVSSRYMKKINTI